MGALYNYKKENMSETEYHMTGYFSAVPDKEQLEHWTLNRL
jgi:hypothetical protein